MKRPKPVADSRGGDADPEGVLAEGMQGVRFELTNSYETRTST